MTHVVFFSGGAGSYHAAKRVVERHGPKDVRLLFTDTLIEDADLYRFLCEAAADVLGYDRAFNVEPLRGRLTSIPPISDPPRRKEHLQALAQLAMVLLPGLHWVMDGRTPWEVFRDSRYLGNTRVAKCSHVLKQDQARLWLERSCDPAETTIYLGIHWSERERYDRAAPLWEPWRCEAPLCDLPVAGTGDAFALMAEAGIRRPRQYDINPNGHANCAGWCVRSGQAGFRSLLHNFPDVYAHHEQKEQELREYLGKDVSILRDRRGGKTVPLTMARFRERVEADGQCDLFDWGGCGCFSSPRGEEEGEDAA
jgi:hypothetical protein